MQTIVQFFEKVSRVALMAFACLLPFFFWPGGSVLISQGKMVLATVVLAVAGLGWCISVLLGSMRVPKHSIVVLSALLPIAYAVSAITAGWPMSSIVSGLGINDTVISVSLWFGLLLITAAIFTDSPRDVQWMLRAFIVGTGAMMLFEIAKLFAPQALSLGLFQNEASTTAGSWHDFGILLGLSVILSLVLVRTSAAHTKAMKLLCYITATLGLLLLVVVNMSDVWYVFGAVSALIAVFLFFRPFDGSWKIQILPWIVLALLSVALGYFNTNVHTYIPEPFKVLAVEVRPSWEGTFAVGQEALSESRTLFFGSGPNSFSRNWALHKPASVNATDFWAFDFNAGVGVLPTAFVTLGVIGLGAWILMSLGFLESVRRIVLRPMGRENWLSFSLAFAILFLFVFHVIYAPGTVVTIFLFLLLGLYVATLLTTPRSPIAQPFVPDEVHSASGVDMIGAAIAAVLIVVVAGVSGRALVSDIIVNNSIIGFSKNSNIQEASAGVARSLVIWSSNDRAHRAAVELGILSMSEQVAGINNPAVQEQLQETLSVAIQHGLAAVEIGRSEYQNWLTLAQLYQELAGVGVGGAYEQAKQAYESARAENPTNPIPLFRLAQLEAMRGNREAAIALLRDAIQIKPNFAAAYYLGSQLLAQSQQFAEAAQAAGVAVQLVPQDPLGWYNLGAILYAGGAYRDAAAAHSQAITLMPNYSNAIFMLALSYAKLDETDAAVSTLTRVIELNPDDENVKKILENIKAKKDPFLGVTGT